MSKEAVIWALEDAPDLPPHLVSALVALAETADSEGRGAFLGQPEIAWRTRKNKRNARKDVDMLEKVGLIRPGDQSLAAYIRGDRRPTVWDLAMERKRAPRPIDEGSHETPRAIDEGMHTTPRSGHEGSHETPRTTGRGVAEDPSQSGNSGHEGSQTSPRDATGGRTRPPNQKKRKNSSSSPRRVTQIADALSIDEDEAQEIYDRIAADPNVKAPGPYIERLIENGDLDRFRPSAPKSATPAYAGPTHPYAADPHTGCCATCGLPDTHPRHGSQP